ncbi:MAG: hypothetical protein Q9219_000781 [cf. Caloplaca sp. 3 TL-2023]
MAEADPNFPCIFVIDIPFPTTRLASSALRALQVDAELSPLVQRSFSLISPSENGKDAGNISTEPRSSLGSTTTDGVNGELPAEEKTVLRTEYKATTNRMLRVSVNGFFESMGVVIGIMQELDADVLAEQWKSA